MDGSYSTPLEVLIPKDVVRYTIFVSDQKQHWNKLHLEGGTHLKKPSNFALEVVKLFAPHSSILELGCGVGTDAFYFAQGGHKVLATDFSEVAIEENKKRYERATNLKFQVMDISKPMSYEDNTFDVLYAMLSLHYFTDKATMEIFKEIERVLKPNGLLCFVCKSIKDPLFGKGEEIEKDIFLRDGHLRHFFSKEYTKECLRNLFTVMEFEEGEESFYQKPSAYIKAIARTVKPLSPTPP